MNAQLGADLITEEQFLEWMPKLGLLESQVIKPTNKDADKLSQKLRKQSLNNNSSGEDEEVEKTNDEDAEKDLRAAFAVFDADHNG